MTRRDRADGPDAYGQALGLLVRREHSRRELKRKLAMRGADPVDAESAIDALALRGYQDDARFAEMLVRTRISGGYGPLHIRAELGTHGIPGDTIAATLEAAEPDWYALAIAAMQRRFGAGTARDRAEATRRAAFLQRRGFDADSVRSALRGLMPD